jgi:CHASE3 domain sensor protein
MVKRRGGEPRTEGLLRRRVTGGLIAAVLLTAVLGVLSWRAAQWAEQDAYWVSHTSEVMATIERASRDVIEAETSVSAFGLSQQVVNRSPIASKVER